MPKDVTDIDATRDVDVWEPHLRGAERCHVWQFVTIYRLTLPDAGAPHKVYVLCCERCGQHWRKPKVYGENARRARAYEKAQSEEGDADERR